MFARISIRLLIFPHKNNRKFSTRARLARQELAVWYHNSLPLFFGFAANTVIVLIYIFLFLFYRIHLKKFILRLVPADQRTETQKVIRETSRVAQKYLIGLALMIVTLWVLYSIGFSIAGVRNAIFFAILCGLLEIVPFVGNITGTALTILMAMTQGGGTNMIVIILVTYVVVQFFQTYILEPLIVGSEVNINPLFTILGIILGELIWGIPGMVLAIPTLGILRVIFDHVPALQPYGFLIGEEKKGKKRAVNVAIKHVFFTAL